MGASRAAEGASRDVAFDSGGLIAFERGNELVRALVEQSAELEVEVVIPASALAQVWRGGPRSAALTRLIASSESDPLDERRAKEVGERLGARGTTDLADAHVVCCALESRAALVTSGPLDMRALIDPSEHLNLIAV